MNVMHSDGNDRRRTGALRQPTSARRWQTWACCPSSPPARPLLELDQCAGGRSLTCVVQVFADQPTTVLQAHDVELTHVRGAVAGTRTQRVRQLCPCHWPMLVLFQQFSWRCKPWVKTRQDNTTPGHPLNNCPVASTTIIVEIRDTRRTHVQAYSR